MTSAEHDRILQSYRQSILDDRQTRFVSMRGIPLPRDRDGASIDPEIELDSVYIRLTAIEQREKRRLDEDEERRLHEQAESNTLQGFLSQVISLGEYQYHDRKIERSIQPVDPAEALDEHKRLVILGAPGAGKSTLLRYLARRYANDASLPVPVLLPLNKFAVKHEKTPALSLSELACEEAGGGDKEISAALAAEAEAGNVLWLLDALDESGAAKGEILNQMRGLKGRLVLTSRSVGYEAVRETTPHFELLPLETADAKKFVKDWFNTLAEKRSEPPAWGAERTSWLEAQLEERPRLQELARNPLLLTFLAVLAGNDPQEELPKNRAGLYHKYVEDLLDGREAGRSQDDPTQPERAARLRAFYLTGWFLHTAFHGGKPQAAPTRANVLNYLEKHFRRDGNLDPAGLAERSLTFWEQAGLLETWNIDENEGAYLTFRHLTFQEYAAAWGLALAWRRDPKRAWKFLRLRLHHPAWREPLLLLGGFAEIITEGSPVSDHPDTESERKKPVLPAEALDDILNSMLIGVSPYEGEIQRDFYLACSILAEGYPVVEESRKACLERLGRQLKNSMDEKVRRAAAEALGKMKDPATVNALSAALRDEDEWVRWAAARALGKIQDPAAVNTLIAALRDENNDVRDVAAMLLGRLQDPAAELALIAALQDENELVRRTAAEALGKIQDPAAVNAIIAELRDADDNVLRAATEMLGTILDPAAVSALLDRLRDEDKYMRRAAVSKVLVAILSGSDQLGFLESACNLISADNELKWEYLPPLLNRLTELQVRQLLFEDPLLDNHRNSLFTKYGGFFHWVIYPIVIIFIALVFGELADIITLPDTVFTLPILVGSIILLVIFNLWLDKILKI